MDRYELSPIRRFVVRAIAVIFFVLGLVDAVQLPMPLIAPRLVAPSWANGTGLVYAPEALLPDEARLVLANNPTLRQRFLARLDRPDVRIRHQALALGIDLPAVAILLGMGMALWRSTRRVPDAVESGLPWLMMVGWSCLVVAVVGPVLDGLRTGLILGDVLSAPRLFWYDPATGGTTYVLLLIAAGILSATWTISAGLRARADMAEIV